MIQFKKKVLSNGLRVISAPMENTDAVTFLVLVGVGSRYETKNINGISHFLEHLFFKGTKSRPKPGQVFKDLDKIGATYNAFTSKETTGFWVKSATDDFDVGLDIVSDILLEPLFKKEEIDRERGVILQEINMYEDEPRRRVWDMLENVMYGDQPIGWDIAGKKEIVAKIKRSDIVNYKNNNYLSKNMVVAVAGNIDPQVVFEKIEKRFKKIKKGKNKASKGAVVFQKKPSVEILSKDCDQTHLAMGIRGYDIHDSRRHALNLLSIILGGNMSSKLFTEIREKLGLAYYVHAYNDQYSDCGYLGIGTGIGHLELEKVFGKIMEIINSLKKKGFSKKDINFAKSFLRGQTALQLESSDEIANYCAGQELFYKKITQPEETLKKIEKVTQHDILKVAKDIFRSGRMNMAIIGAQEDSAKKELFYKKLFSKI